MSVIARIGLGLGLGLGLGVRLGMMACLALASNQVFAKAYVVIASGLGGNAEYTDSFRETVRSIEANFTPGSRWLGGETALSLLQGDKADREAILSQLQAYATSVKAEDSLVLMLVGHGSYDGERYLFNIPGPDLSGSDLKQALDGIAAQRQLVVLATSASGVMLQQLEQPGRIVITATKSGGEINAVAFPEYWAVALTTDKADYDRNEIVTVDEAFRYTQNAVNSHYAEQNLLASEHARIAGDDSGRQAVALIGSLKQVGDNPAILKMLERRALLETELQALRATRQSLETTRYYTDLQELMLRMARLQLDIDRMTGWLPAAKENAQ